MGTLKVEVYPYMFIDKSIKEINSGHGCMNHVSRFWAPCTSCHYAMVYKIGINRYILVCSHGVNFSDSRLLTSYYFLRDSIIGNGD
jgi:ssDNA-binding Zn-finger/Zn-ribbon topoisomerase 1